MTSAMSYQGYSARIEYDDEDGILVLTSEQASA